MLTIHRKWQSIDRKLPLLASGLVLLTAVVLGWTAYVELERALLQSAGARLAGTAQAVAQMIQRPGRVVDPVTRETNAALRAFARGETTRDSAIAQLGRAQIASDTARFYAAFVDIAGRVVLAYHRPPVREPHWVLDAIARGDVRGDTVSVGPFENVGGSPVITTVRPLRDSNATTAPLLGYVVDARTISSARGARAFRNVVGEDVTLLIGQPGAGVWTDLAKVSPPPPLQLLPDGPVIYPGGVGATARIAGVNWVVWVSQPTDTVLAPARGLWWTMLPLGILIALLGAALMWRMAHRITHPIARLTESAEGIARDANALPETGEMPAAVRDADEVTRLRFAFDRMAERVAERETLEIELRQAQKMEAIGRLAGGIAHDFNNLLTAIRSYADLLIEDMPAWDSKRADVEEIRKAAHRATSLTSQLLAFSRKQMLQPRVLDTTAVLQDMQAMLQRLLIKEITLDVDTTSGVWPVKADRGQLEQVIVNLAVNARDAMPEGGSLMIGARNQVVSEAMATRHGPVPAGEYVAIRVADTGSGMDAATQSRAFEPFFTTKEVGQGTGLGLSTVHGIVSQSGGYVTVDSDSNSGTTFTVFLPRAHAEISRESGPTQTAGPGNSETILLVEDEVAVRSLARRVLVRAGFRVLESTTPTDALRLAHEHVADIRLVLSDVVMPEMSGPALVEKLKAVCPDARVLYISGFTDDEVIGRGLASPGLMLLQKPFSAQQLVDRVRSAMNTPEREEDAA